MRALEDCRFAVVGLGYVGLPLAAALGARFDTLGLDIDAGRIDELRHGRDRTGELDAAELAAATRLAFTADADLLRGRDVIVVTVPTPINEHKQPDFGPLRAASEAIGARLAPGTLVIYESTVYPGATEEICVPVLEAASGLRFGVDFHVGYSPERINPGDRRRRLPDIARVVAGSSPEVGDFLEAMYGAIVPAGVHRAPSIRVAEAAKVIENTQRDANIALINEFALIFHRLGIDTADVLAAAGTKWNFLPFRPGLVGGHCIGVDPYYLIQKAQSVGYHPDILIACRRINDAMGGHVAAEVVKLLIRRGAAVRDARVLVLGLTFKENCGDLRNTRVVELVRELESFGTRVDVHDPLADPARAREEYGLALVAAPEPGAYDAIVLAVAHDAFASLGADGVRRWGRAGAVVYDIKSVLPAGEVDGRL